MCCYCSYIFKWLDVQAFSNINRRLSLLHLQCYMGCKGRLVRRCLKGWCFTKGQPHCIFPSKNDWLCTEQGRLLPKVSYFHFSVSHLKIVFPNSFPHCFLALGEVAFTMKTLPRFPLQFLFVYLEDKATCYSQTQQDSEKSLHFAASKSGTLQETWSKVCSSPLRQWRNQMSFSSSAESYL